MCECRKKEVVVFEVKKRKEREGRRGRKERIRFPIAYHMKRSS